jgi:hypothetical protein
LLAGKLTASAQDAASSRRIRTSVRNNIAM